MSVVLNLSSLPIVMGVLNVAPNFFISHGAQDENIGQAIAQGESMLADGAACIDVLGEPLQTIESKISIKEEIERVVPVIEILSKRVSIPISVNTSNPEVMLAAVNAGASIINDIRALTKPGALNMAAKLGVYVCLMHMYNDPSMVHTNSGQQDLVSSIYQYLQQRVAACIAAGMDARKIIVDPGLGFGMSLPQNLSLMRSLAMFKKLNCPLLVGIDNTKSMLGQILDVPVEERIYGSITAAIVAISRGADIIRTAEVKATVDAIKVLKALA